MAAPPGACDAARVIDKEAGMPSAEEYLLMAIDLASQNVRAGGRPFGAVVVKDDEVIATGVNLLHEANDPTTHAELQAIRAASAALGTPRLDGCIVYASGHPCPMCLGAMYLTGVSAAHYAYSNEDGERYGLSTARIYAELRKPPAEQSLPMTHHRVRRSGEDLYAAWRDAARGAPAT
jgi:tRNA(Arg) A34 adenosine deaminase TadA